MNEVTSSNLWREVAYSAESPWHCRGNSITSYKKLKTYTLILRDMNASRKILVNINRL